MPNSSGLPSILLTLILITGITICFRQLNFSLMNEVKAIISIVFGFITSCMLLSFVWLIQRKSLHTIWSEQQQQQVGLDENEVPNMHPRVMADYEDSMDGRHSRSNNISTISSSVEQPPNYEDALINSKPINWIYLGSGKDTSVAGSPDTSNNYTCPSYKSITNNEIQSSFHISSASSSMAQLAMSIVKNITSLEPDRVNPTTIQQVMRSQSLPEHNNNNTSPIDIPQMRKPSYYQLDVSQLMLSQSPPKYSELSFGNEAYTNRTEDSVD